MDDHRAEELGTRVAEIAWEVSEALGATHDAVEAQMVLAREPS